MIASAVCVFLEVAEPSRLPALAVRQTMICESAGDAGRLAGPARRSPVFCWPLVLLAFDSRDLDASP